MNDTDKEILRRVYQDELDSLRGRLAEALDDRTETDLALTEARRRHVSAVSKHATLQGRVDALRDLAAKEGVTLDS